MSRGKTRVIIDTRRRVANLAGGIRALDGEHQIEAVDRLEREIFRCLPDIVAAADSETLAEAHYVEFGDVTSSRALHRYLGTLCDFESLELALDVIRREISSRLKNGLTRLVERGLLSESNEEYDSWLATFYTDTFHLAEAVYYLEAVPQPGAGPSRPCSDGALERYFPELLELKEAVVRFTSRERRELLADVKAYLDNNIDAVLTAKCKSDNRFAFRMWRWLSTTRELDARGQDAAWKALILRAASAKQRALLTRFENEARMQFKRFMETSDRSNLYLDLWYWWNVQRRIGTAIAERYCYYGGLRRALLRFSKKDPLFVATLLERYKIEGIRRALRWPRTKKQRRVLGAAISTLTVREREMLCPEIDPAASAADVFDEIPF